jgi:hypothetical protein
MILSSQKSLSECHVVNTIGPKSNSVIRVAVYRISVVTYIA